MKTFLPTSPVASSNSTDADRYREQLSVFARAMARAEGAATANLLARDSNLKGVELFLEGNLEKRFEKLDSQLQFLADGFTNLPTLIDEYMQAVPSAPYDTAVADADRLLNWLIETQPLSAEQHDYVACQAARHRVEEQARNLRLQHVRFQERYSLIEKWLVDFEEASQLRLYLNPIRVWATFRSQTFLDADSAPPAQVLFFPQHGEICTAVLDLEGQALVNELADFHPCTFADWSAVSHFGDQQRLIETVRTLARIGLVALG